jgi:hypothetical protein
MLMYPKGELGVFGSNVPHLCVGSAQGAISIFPMEKAGQVHSNFVSGYEEFSMITRSPLHKENA